MIATSNNWTAIIDENGARVIGPNYERDVTDETNRFIDNTLLRDEVLAEFMLELAEADFGGTLPGAKYIRDGKEKYVIVAVQ